MQYLLDTNIFIYLCKGTYPAIADHIRSFSPGDIVISSITLAELEFGIAKSAKPEKNRKHLEAIDKTYIRNLKVNYVNNMSEVLELALQAKPIKDKLDFSLFMKHDKK